MDGGSQRPRLVPQASARPADARRTARHRPPQNKLRSQQRIVCAAPAIRVPNLRSKPPPSCGTASCRSWSGAPVRGCGRQSQVHRGEAPGPGQQAAGQATTCPPPHAASMIATDIVEPPIASRPSFQARARTSSPTGLHRHGRDCWDRAARSTPDQTGHLRRSVPVHRCATCSSRAHSQRAAVSPYRTSYPRWLIQTRRRDHACASSWFYSAGCIATGRCPHGCNYEGLK